MIPALILTASLLTQSPSLPPASQAALASALEDERNTEAYYAAVMVKFGARRPFSNIIEAERRHQAALGALFEAYHVPLPALRPTPPRSVPDTFEAACRIAAQAELENVALYDRLLKDVKEQDLRDVFERLRWASQERHLPAFRRQFSPGR